MTGASRESRVPFRLPGERQPLILLPVTVNGYGPSSFVLDTGAGLNLITRRLASLSGIEAAEVRRGVGAAGAVTLDLGVADTFRVGDTSLRGLRIGITDELLRIGATVGAQIDGVVGYNFLQRFCLSIDYRRRFVTLTCSVAMTGSAPGEATPFRLAAPDKPLVLVDAFVNEEGPFRFVLDTGASTTAVSGEVASRLGLRRAAMPAVTGGGGVITAGAARVDSIRLGIGAAGPLDLVVTDATEHISRTLGESIDGILGYNFLSNFAVVIDYLSSVISLND